MGCDKAYIGVIWVKNVWHLCGDKAYRRLLALIWEFVCSCMDVRTLYSEATRSLIRFGTSLLTGWRLVGV